MKKIKLLFVAIAMIASYSLTAQIGINKDGTASDASAMLDVKATDVGFLPPRMTESQMNAIASPAEGLMIYCTDCVPKSIRVYNGNHWVNSNGVPELASDEVFNPTTGEIWKDRNLGASQVATSSTDAAAYGDLYQWGRLSDGHESRTSGTTSTNSSTDVPGHSNFITENSSPFDWRVPQNDNLWQGVNGINNPCPSGFRLPTDAEWEAERQSWATNNAAGAFGSVLKLTVGGLRRNYSGALAYVGSYGFYWSSTVSSIHACGLGFHSTAAWTDPWFRASGVSVRCIKD
ncbi:MAG: fibrobacter succinogenes major paralogous domain-containing protein [Bacteroidales bacterium]|nr:fibrobacter succinogenes major paralogous domain-containing protein [Bacteroidales bacterium]